MVFPPPPTTVPGPFPIRGLTRRHLGQAPRDLAQRLGPAGGGVGHHADVVAHVAEVLGERDACAGSTRLAPGGWWWGRGGHTPPSHPRRQLRPARGHTAPGARNLPPSPSCATREGSRTPRVLTRALHARTCPCRSRVPTRALCAHICACSHVPVPTSTCPHLLTSAHERSRVPCALTRVHLRLCPHLLTRACAHSRVPVHAHTRPRALIYAHACSRVPTRAPVCLARSRICTLARARVGSRVPAPAHTRP